MPSNFNPTRSSQKIVCDICNKDKYPFKLQLSLRLGFVLTICPECEGQLTHFLVNSYLIHRRMLKSGTPEEQKQARHHFVGPVVKSQALTYLEKRMKEKSADA